MATKKKAVKKKTVATKKKTATVKKVKQPVSVTVNVTVNPVQKKPKVRKNYLMMVLDESSSMASIKPQAISAFNEQVQTVKNSKGSLEVSVNLVKFASGVSTVFTNQNVDNVQQLNGDTYQPNGSTAMYDGVGQAIEFLKAQPDINDPEVTVLMLIISDGEENCSRVWNASRVSEELKTLQATNRWTVTYAGANQDLAKISRTLNIPLGNTVSFQASAGGMSANNALRSKGTSMLYDSYQLGTQSVSSFYSPPTVDTTTKTDLLNKTPSK